MKLLNYATLIFLLFLVPVSHLHAQGATEGTQSIDEGSIGDQFDYVLKKSSNWDSKGISYEVIKRSMMATLKSHTLDSLRAIQVKLDNTRGIVSSQQTEIDGLKSDLTKTQELLDQTNKDKESMSFLGMQMTKAGYSSLMWALVAVLLTGLLFFLFRFKNSNIVTKATKEKLAEIESEFKEHRKVALEREQKIKRQLQDEMNKHRT